MCRDIHSSDRYRNLHPQHRIQHNLLTWHYLDTPEDALLHFGIRNRYISESGSNSKSFQSFLKLPECYFKAFCYFYRVLNTSSMRKFEDPYHRLSYNPSWWEKSEHLDFGAPRRVKVGVIGGSWGSKIKYGSKCLKLPNSSRKVVFSISKIFSQNEKYLEKFPMSKFF